jgi:DNA-binding NarL/FixJ family response regulator
VIRVGVVDDHPVVLDGLAAALERQPEVTVAWRAATVAEARARLAEDRCDVVLVDVRLPDGSGLDLVAPSDSGPAFVVLSSWDRRQYARSAFARGTAGYLLKTAPMDEVVAALRIAAAGGSAFPPAQRAALDGAPELSSREVAVVRLVAEGWSNDETAARLSVSTKTVEAYLSRLYERWGVSTRTELALRAEREGWLDAQPDHQAGPPRRAEGPHGPPRGRR